MFQMSVKANCAIHSSIVQEMCLNSQISLIMHSPIRDLLSRDVYIIPFVPQTTPAVCYGLVCFCRAVHSYALRMNLIIRSKDESGVDPALEDPHPSVLPGL